MSENPDATIGAECFVPVYISHKPAVLAILTVPSLSIP